jgi:DtxR family Mn-dependent transcriptional regulator
MKSHTETEENYLKAVFSLLPEKADDQGMVHTNSIAQHLGTSAASVTDMVKRLAEKDLLAYKPYRGVSLTEKGQKIALNIVRKHRLWEVFLVEKLLFSWDNVHDVAEQLEHIQSPELIRRLDEFLGKPKYDPHGDPIPSETGEIQKREAHRLTDIKAGQAVTIVGVSTDESNFLKYLDKLGLTLGTKILVTDRIPFDNSIQIEKDNMLIVISGNVAGCLTVMLEA